MGRRRQPDLATGRSPTATGGAASWRGESSGNGFKLQRDVGAVGCSGSFRRPGFDRRREAAGEARHGTTGEDAGGAGFQAQAAGLEIGRAHV